MPNIQGFDAACDEYGRPTLAVSTNRSAASALWHQEEGAPYDDWSSWIELPGMTVRLGPITAKAGPALPKTAARER